MAAHIMSASRAMALRVPCTKVSMRTNRNRMPLAVRAEADNNTPVEPAAPAATPVTVPTPAPRSVSFGDAMAFSGPAPETVNGRLAMLGFVAALGAELASGETVAQQLSDAPFPILVAFVAFAYASLVPIVKGANMQEAFGPLTPSVELLNGRLAMLGLVALVVVEYFKGSALF